ncbi:MAG: porin family protein [Gammaproteobacteria bacterium]|nr:porin family protein [Gammaproteobacteria bacterium]
MRHVLRVSGLLVLLLLGAESVSAGVTFGAKTGPVQPGLDGIEDPINAGVTIGYESGIALGALGFEGEFTTTVKEGEFGVQKLNIDTAGAYATYRSPGLLYLKGRVGYAGWDADFSVAGNTDDTSTSYGLGLGVSLKLIKIELEYTQIDDDIDFVSLGIQF